MYYFVEVLVPHIFYLPSIYCNCFGVNGKSKNIFLEHFAFIQFASITSDCLLQFSWWLCLHFLSLLPQLKNALEIIHIFEKIKAYNFSFGSFRWKCDCSTVSDCGVWRVKGLETSKHSQYSSVFKPKRTKFAMCYIFINVRLSSAISRTTSLHSGSKWEEDLWGNVFWAASPNPSGLALPAATASFSWAVPAMP